MALFRRQRALQCSNAALSAIGTRIGRGCSLWPRADIAPDKEGEQAAKAASQNCVFQELIRFDLSLLASVCRMRASPAQNMTGRHDSLAKRLLSFVLRSRRSTKNKGCQAIITVNFKRLGYIRDSGIVRHVGQNHSVSSDI